MKKDETKKTRPKTAAPAVNKKDVFEKMAKNLKVKVEKAAPGKKAVN